MKVYPQTKENSIRVYKQRAHYDYKTIQGIVNDSHVVHVAFLNKDGEIRNLPMIGVWGWYNKHQEDPNFYLHGNCQSMLYQDVEGKQAEVKVCVTATQVDGIVMVHTPNGHSLNYRSAVIHGTARLVQSRDEKEYCMKQVVDHMVPGRRQHIDPVMESAIDKVQVFKVEISSASAKVRTGFGTLDNPRDGEHLWSGVVPLYRKFGDPVESPDNRAVGHPVQEHITEMIENKNNEWETYATDVARD